MREPLHEASPLRIALHFILAFGLYAALIWVIVR